MKRIFIAVFAALVTMESLAAVLAPSGRGPEMIDLGLSVKWAACNLGAKRPEEFGRYFAWGDVIGQVRNKSSWSGDGFGSYPSYQLDSDGNLFAEYDAAHVLLGGFWRMPTKEEFEELIDNCTSTWTDDYKGTGVAGLIFTGKKPGYTDRSIFLPATGQGRGRNLSYSGSFGYYWSGTLNYGNFSWNLDIDSGGVAINYNNRSYGLSLRPVFSCDDPSAGIDGEHLGYQRPSFNGGDANEFLKWVNQSLVYPEIAKKNGIQGRVVLQFTIDEDGSVTNVKVIRGVHPLLDNEAVRVVSSSPKWNPGREFGHPVRSTFTLPVVFSP